MNRFYDEDEAFEAGCESGATSTACGAEREMDRMEAGWGKERAALVDQIRHMANVTHQAHHGDSAVGWLECDKAFCSDARRAIGIRS